jgi:hypothetical protein
VAITLVGCSGGGGGSGASPYSYQQGFEIASHELVQTQIQAGASPAGACEDAFNAYSMTDAGLKDKSQYIQGCEDGLDKTPVTTSQPTHNGFFTP